MLNVKVKSHQVTEAINLADVTALFLTKGYMLYRPEADVGGIDFLLSTPGQKILKCQLKSRPYVEWNRYGGKDLFMVFPDDKTTPRDWYLVPHDTLFLTLKEQHGHAPKWNHPKFGEYWHCPVSLDLKKKLSKFKI